MNAQAPGLTEKQLAMEDRYRSPYHWVGDALSPASVMYFGYINLALGLLPPPPAKVLDGGCGDGRASAEMVRRGYEVTGCDALDIAVYYAAHYVPDGTFFTADLSRDLRSQSNTELPAFDAATLIEVYEHIPSEKCPAVLRNLHSVLSDEGLLILTVPSMYVRVGSYHERHFDQSVLERELGDAGWRVEEVLHQHRLGLLTRFVLSARVEEWLNNRWIQPVVLKHLRKRLYRRFCNRAGHGRPFGRLIVKASKLP